MVKPYYDIRAKDICDEWIRIFDEDAEGDEMVWHRDLKDREIFVIEGDGWKFQRENELPIDLERGTKLTIEKMVYHRLIKGNSQLMIKIKEQEEVYG